LPQEDKSTRQETAMAVFFLVSKMLPAMTAEENGLDIVGNLFMNIPCQQTEP
jgi:hypothetical protein